MKKRIMALFLVSAMLLTACGGTPTVTSTPPAPSTEASTPGEAITKPERPSTSNDYTTVYASEVVNLNYLWSQSTAEQQFGANCVSGLVENDEYGNILLDLATEATVSSDGLVWTFKIREGVMWYTWDKQEYDETTAYDFVAAARWYLNKNNASRTANLVYDVIKNGREYFEGESGVAFEDVGIKAIDRYTVQYTLSRPVPYFLSMLTYTIFYPASAKLLEEVGDERFATDHTTFVSNGAYIMTRHAAQEERIMEKNENYYDADKVLINKLHHIYNKEASTLAPEMFLRGEISAATIPVAMLSDWYNDPAKSEMVRPSWGKIYNYFFILNFWPNPDVMDPKYEPENWEVAVNNLSFRKALFHGLNRLELTSVYEPFDPEALLTRTVTPPFFVSDNGVDYTQLGDLKQISDTDPFNPELALQFKEQAMKELEGKATFPVVLFYPYVADNLDAANMAQTMQQGLQRVLGEDFIKVEIEAYPGTGFSSATRTAGNFGILTFNWGADYIDPETYSDMLRPEEGVSINWAHMMKDFENEEGVNRYLAMLNEAQAEYFDLSRRYLLFANAEAFMIDQCIAMPWRYTRTYTASTMIPFTQQWSNAGSSGLKFKGVIYGDEYFNTEKFNALYQIWVEEQAESAKNYKPVYTVVD